MNAPLIITEEYWMNSQLSIALLKDGKDADQIKAIAKQTKKKGE